MKKLICLFVCLFASAANATPVLVNGSFDDLNGVATPNPSSTSHNGLIGSAPGWTTFAPTPDWAAPGFSTVYAPNMTSSPDGGPWAMGYSSNSIFESFGQTVLGFEVGKTYELSFYQAHNSSNSSFSADGAWSVSLFGTTLLSDILTDLGDNQMWFQDSMQFVATTTSSLLQFTVGTANTGISIDGIAIAEVGTTTTVPEPTSLALLGFGLAGIGFSRKKKNT